MAEDGKSTESISPEEAEKVVSEVASGSDRIDVPKELLDDDTTDRHEDPESRPLGVRVREMTIPQRMKLAMRGGREARGLLVRDPVPMVQRLVLQNPRITEDEVLIIANDRNADKDIVRQITESREWTGSYGIRRALCENPKTPLVAIGRLMMTLTERDIRSIARSRNVSSAVSSQARRILYVREQRKRG